MKFTKQIGMAPKITNPHIVEHRKLGREQAWGIAWMAENKISIDQSLTGYRYLLYLLHEHFHLKQYKLTELQKDRSYISSIRAYPINLEIRSVKTFNVSPPSLKRDPSDPPGLPGGIAAGAVTFELNTSIIMLPKVPMRKRLFDPRVGFFATGYTVYTDDSQKAEDETIAVRWRLEPKNEADAKKQGQAAAQEKKKKVKEANEIKKEKLRKMLYCRKSARIVKKDIRNSMKHILS